MLHNLLAPFANDFILFNLFEYLTFRSGGAVMTAFFFSLVIGKPLISWLKSRQGEGQPIRDDGPEGHLISKKNTPTMGGSLILLSVAIATLLWADLTNGYVWIIMFVTSTFGLVGFLDDWMKVTKQNPKGMKSRTKMGLLVLFGLMAAILISLMSPENLRNHFAIPFFKDLLIPFYWFFPFISLFVIVGSSNAVNLTDGLDGLAIVPIMIAAASLGLIAYLVGHYNFSEYLEISFIRGAGELTVFCAALIGAGMGFLWFNAPPAMVFMGDTGSLSTGGALGTIAVITKHELVLAVVGGLFVVETLSVVIQVASFKLTGKRVFLMAPLHHHFEKKGWSEPTIVIRFWIIAVVLALIGLSTLKIR